MATIAQLAPADQRQLDLDPARIGPLDVLAVWLPITALLDGLADRPLPRDPHVVAAIRELAAAGIAALPAGHPLAGADVAGAGAPMLVRLLVRLARDLAPTHASDA